MIQLNGENYFTAKEVCAMFNISRQRLIAYRRGRNVLRVGRVEWSENSILDENTDYIIQIIDNRLNVLYSEQAIIKIQNKKLTSQQKKQVKQKK